MLCEDGRVSAVGRMDELRQLDGDVVELDGRGLSAVPGLVDCHTHACFAGDRVDEFSRRAAGATYQELHAAGGGILPPSKRRAPPGRTVSRRRSLATAPGCSRAGTTTFEAKSGYGLDHDTELAQLRVVRKAGGIPTWLGAHAVPPEFPDADAYLDFALSDVLPEAAARRGCRRVPRARRVRRRLRPAATSRPAGRRPRAVAPRRPVHRGGRHPARDRARRALGGSPRGHRSRGRPRASGSDVAAVLLPRRGALPRSLRCRRACAPRGGRDRRAGNRLQSWQRVLREHPGRHDPRLHPAGPRARCRARRVHRERRARPRPGRPAWPGLPRYIADLVLLDAPDWRHLAYHFGSDLISVVVKDGEVAWTR